MILLLILGLSPSLFGQAVNATLLGTITDSSGATVAGAKVTATETATGLIHESVTNESGNYTFPDMPPGKYSLTAEAKGFKKDTHQNIDLLSNSSTRVDYLYPHNNNNIISRHVCWLDCELQPSALCVGI